MSGTAKDTREEAAHGGIKNCNFCSQNTVTVRPEDEKAHVGNENHLLPHEICLNVVPSQVLPFKIIKSISEKLQDGLKQKTLRNISLNHQASEKAREGHHHCTVATVPKRVNVI